MYFAPAAAAAALLPTTGSDYFWLFMAAFTLVTAFGALLRVLPRRER
jgi:hypothetical protein